MEKYRYDWVEGMIKRWKYLRIFSVLWGIFGVVIFFLSHHPGVLIGVGMEFGITVWSDQNIKRMENEYKN